MIVLTAKCFTASCQHGAVRHNVHVFCALEYGTRIRVETGQKACLNTCSILGCIG